MIPPPGCFYILAFKKLNMIDPKELRMGNWVMLDTGYTLPVPHQIKAEDIYDIENGLPDGIIIEPIELTPEILEKVGFDKVDDIEFRKGRLTFQAAKYEDFYRVNVFIDGSLLCFLDNLHQLQNLYYSLTGQELTYAP